MIKKSASTPSKASQSRRDTQPHRASPRELTARPLTQRGQASARPGGASAPRAPRPLTSSRDVSSFTPTAHAGPRLSAPQRPSLDGGAGRPTLPLAPRDGGTLRVNPALGLPLALRAPVAGSATPVQAQRAPSAAERAETLNARVQNAQNYDELRQAAEEVAREFESNPSPAYQRELAEALAPALRRLGEFSTLTDPATGEGTALPEALARATAAASPEAAASLAEAFVEGLGDQPLPAPLQLVLERPEAAQLAEALQTAFQQTGNAEALEAISAALERGAYLSEAAASVQGAQRALDNAQREAAALDEQLASELAVVGPALTDAQRQAYVEQFRSDNAATYQRVDEAAAELAEALRDPELAQAVQNSPVVAESVLHGYESLASTSEAAAVIEWGGQVLADPQSPLYRAFAAAEPGFARRLGDEVLPSAVEHAASGLLADADFNPAQAAGQLAELLTPLRNARGLAGSALSLSTADWDNFLNGLRGAAQGNTDRLESLLSSWSAGGGLGGARQSLAVTGLLFGIVGARSAAADGDLAAFAGAVTGALPNGAQLLSYALGRLGNSAQAASLGGAAAAQAAAGALARAVPVLSAIGGSVASARDLGELINDPSWGRAVSALGSFAAAAGSVAALVGTTGPVGGVIVAVGGIISVVGGLLEAREARAETQRNIQERLRDIGLDAELADTLSRASPEASQALTEFGLTPLQLQRAAELSPELVTSGSTAEQLIELGQAFGLEAHQLLRFASAAVESGEDLGQLGLGVVNGALLGLGGQVGTPEGREQYHQAIRSILENNFPELAALAQQLSTELPGLPQ